MTFWPLDPTICIHFLMFLFLFLFLFQWLLLRFPLHLFSFLFLLFLVARQTKEMTTRQRQVTKIFVVSYVKPSNSLKQATAHWILVGQRTTKRRHNSLKHRD